MATYTATIALGGAVHNQVNRAGLSGPEVVLLAAIHGEGSVTNVRVDDEKAEQRTDAEEREYLIENYSPKYVEKVFGNAYQPLPTEAPGLLPPRRAPRKGLTSADVATSDMAK